MLFFEKINYNCGLIFCLNIIRYFFKMKANIKDVNDLLIDIFVKFIFSNF